MNTLCCYKNVSAEASSAQRRVSYLLVSNGEFALCLLIRIRERLKLLHSIRLQDLDAELDVAFGVFMAGLSIVSRPPECWNDTCLRRLWCHLAERQESRSKPCPSPVACPRKSVRSLSKCQRATNDGPADTRTIAYHQ